MNDSSVKPVAKDRMKRKVSPLPMDNFCTIFSSPSPLSHPLYLQVYGECIEKTPSATSSSILQKLTKKIEEEMLDFMPIMIKRSDLEGKAERNPLTNRVKIICEYLCILITTMERVRVDRPSFRDVREACEGVILSILSPSLSDVIENWFRSFPPSLSSHSLNASANSLSVCNENLEFDSSVLCGLFFGLFHSSVRLYDCCLQWERENEAKEVGSVAETGYFGFISHDGDIECDDEVWMSEHEKSVDFHADERNSSGISTLSLFFIWRKIGNLSFHPEKEKNMENNEKVSVPCNFFLSPSMLRVRSALLSITLHMLQEIVRKRNEQSLNSKGFKKWTKKMDFFMNFLLDDLKLIVLPHTSGVLDDQKTGFESESGYENYKNHLKSYGTLWGSLSSYSSLLWRTIMQIICTLPPSHLPLSDDGEEKERERIRKYVYAEIVSLPPSSVFRKTWEWTFFDILFSQMFGRNDEIRGECEEEKLEKICQEENRKEICGSLFTRSPLMEIQNSKEFCVAGSRFLLQSLSQDVRVIFKFYLCKNEGY